ncbi:MAG: hypothetical protein QOD00_2705, partial [Blastocatellia bacterium]|nr:hypothetical protein [Blastocatellia bacterium]
TVGSLAERFRQEQSAPLSFQTQQQRAESAKKATRRRRNLRQRQEPLIEPEGVEHG